MNIDTADDWIKYNERVKQKTTDHIYPSTRWGLS